MRPVDFGPSPIAPRPGTDDSDPVSARKSESPPQTRAREDRWDSGPVLRIREPRHYDPVTEKGWVDKEVEEVQAGPGFKYLIPNPENVRISDKRSLEARSDVDIGVTAVPGGELQVTDIFNPNSRTGQWDP